MLPLRDEESEYKGARRTPVALPRYGGAAVSSSMDPKLLAGMGISCRFFRIVPGDHPIPDEKRSEAPGAPDEGRTGCREGEEPEDYNVVGVCRFCGPDCFPRTRSSLRMVSRAFISRPCRRRACRNRLPRHLFRVQKKYVYLGHY